jgi:D-sedoheptulose 7-phosphate isomerase
MTFFRDYLEDICAGIKDADPIALELLSQLFRAVSGCGRKVILVGNGGSAAMASHVAVDLTKTAGVRAVNFNEADLLTCFANDYGYALWVERALEFYADPGDAAVLISSSGRSPNIVNGATAARARGLHVVTFSGFDADNPLRSLGELNFWVNSHSYNAVEMAHHVWLLAAVDRLASEKGAASESTSAPPAHGRPGLYRDGSDRRSARSRL